MVKCGVKEEERLRKRNRMCQDFHMETKVKNIFFIYFSFLFFGCFDAFDSRGESFVFSKTSRVAERKWLN